ncbi:carbohydrate ABC transporter permease [Aestuariivirga sp.]|uniref:carbohydrate ABC transporter permease n=1 Tax=Aestuariivirga sp. TaxID=2650926 RepID=UPI00359409A3
MLDRIRLEPSRFVLHLAVFIIVALWTLPTAGLLVSSLRDKDQIAVSGWWTALSTSEQRSQARTKGKADQVETDGKFVIAGNFFEGAGGHTSLSAWGTIVNKPDANAPGATVEIGEGQTLTVNADGSYVWTNANAFEDDRGRRIFYVSSVPPRFTTENYENVLFSQGIGRAFVNSLTVTIPATIIPILIAAFAAYALAWMKIPGRGFIIAVIVGLLVVPLQMSLIPLLKIYNASGFLSKTYLGIWLAHTGFGLPFAIYLLRSYIAGLPKDLIESAQVDGANDFKIFRRIILPLSFPALASFAIFQFLWVWNDLLVAMVFLGSESDKVVLTFQLNSLLGSRGGNWEILTASAFITIIVPLLVFFSLQRYFVRGLLAGSVKGG